MSSRIRHPIHTQRLHQIIGIGRLSGRIQYVGWQGCFSCLDSLSGCHSNVKGSDTGILLEGLSDLLIDQYLKFEFRVNNNQAEYEAFIVDMFVA